jgi:DNA-binding NarL/FixJ family response regulator
MIRVVIADDHHLVRQGIRALLESQDDIQVVGEAKDGYEALELVEYMEPDVLVLDINMPRLEGIEAMKKVFDLDLKTQVLILSMYSDESLIKKAVRNGAKGYLLKRSVTEELLCAIRAASQGEVYLSSDILQTFDIDWLDIQDSSDESDPLERLTDRERQIFKLIADGYTNNAVASDLGISVKTVEKHRSNLMEKLGVQDMAGLIREAIKQGLIFLEG